MTRLSKPGRIGAAVAGALVLGVLSAAPAASAVIVLNGPPANDVDTSPATVATINAPGGTIADIDVSVHITGLHMEDWDLVIEHLGTVVLLRAEELAAGHVDPPFMVTFDDEAAAPIVPGTNTHTGTFQPAGLLSAFDGMSLAGTWNLRILDNYVPGEGDDLIAWSITATTTAAVPEPATLALLGLGLAGLGFVRRRRVS